MKDQAGLDERAHNAAGEEWRPLPQPYGHYEASSYGRVRGTRGVIMGRLDNKGYMRIGLWSVGKVKLVKRASAVAQAFHGARPDGLHIAHLDGDRQNDRPENLAYVTASQNEAHKFAHGTSLLGCRNPQVKLSEEAVREIRRSALTQAKLATLHRVSPPTIRDILTKRTWSHV